jgi:ABC-2 type transport system ATP-binding protein
MRLVLGLDGPTRGDVTVGGKRYRYLPAPLRDVGALIDAKAIHPSRSAYHHLLGLAQSNGIPARRVDEVLGLVGLEAVAGRRVGGFSLGMSQLLGIAAALLGDPPVLMFDEPVNGLDPEGIVWIRRLMRDLAADGRTVVVSSQPALPNMMPSLPGMGSMFPSWPGVRSRCYANHYEHRTSLPTDRGH